MSHFTVVKTKLKNQELVTKALTRMGLKFEKGNFKITQYGTTSKAEIRLDDAVGLSLQEDGTYAMVGDFYHSTNQGLRKYYSKNDQFSQDLGSNYAVEEAVQTLEEHNFFCTENAKAELGEDGLIHMVFTNGE